MILCFPDLDTFRLAATGTLLPVEITLAPAKAHFPPDGRIFIESDSKISKKVAAELTRLGVTGEKALPSPAEEISCWLQAIDVERDAAPPLSTQAPVIFEVPDPALMPHLVGEMLRLGNDRQSYCWIDRDSAQHVLLRVVGPPYYTLLQSLDPQSSGSVKTLTAFLERGPRVWVQIGYEHSAAGRIKLADEQTLLIRPGRNWTFLDNPPFQDIYNALKFPLATAPTVWQPIAAPEKLTVPLKLAAGNAADVPEFWVLHTDAVYRLDAFVRDADDRLVQRLRFAVSEPFEGEERVIVLRLSPSKLPPPVLELPGAHGFKPYFKLPNLFIPTGLRLHPQLRRDAVRTLLANDPDRVVWLTAAPGGEFLPESMAESAFQPLDQWVKYILDSSPVPLKEWISATLFDFDSFICVEGAKPPAPPHGPKDRRGKEVDSQSPLQPSSPALPVDPKAVRFAPTTPKPVDEAQRIDEWKLRRQALQDEFQKFEGALDHPERQQLWPALAKANTGAGDPAEAAICWVNAMWERESPDDGFMTGWFQTEHPKRATGLEPNELDGLLKSQNPDRIEVRQLASAVLFGLTRDTVSDAWKKRLPSISQYLEANDSKLPVRAVWLIALEMASLTGSDVLGLARVRDRILTRLLDSGLNAETDLPFFLRTAGLKDSERVRLVRDRAVELHVLCRKWAEKTSFAPYAYGFREGDSVSTLAYIDLFFAYGYAKLGESSAARRLIEKWRGEIEQNVKSDERLITKKYLYEAFIYRVEEVLAGKVPSRTFPAPLSQAVESLATMGKGVDNSPHKNSYNAIVRLRAQSTILEPLEKYDRLNKAAQGGDHFQNALRDLSLAREPSELIRQVRLLYRGGIAGSEPRSLATVQFLTLHAAMPWAIRVGEAFTLELLNLVPAVLKASPSSDAVRDLTTKQAELLERSLFFAAHFGRRDLVQELLGQLIDLAGSKSKDQRLDMINIAAQQCLKCLLRVGLRDEIDKLQNRLLTLVLEGNTFAQLKTRTAARPMDWGRTLQTLLILSGGWLRFGNFDLSDPILDEARSELLARATPTGTRMDTLIPVFYAKLARAYIEALGHGPSESGLNRLTELFRDMDPKRLTIGGTYARFFSELHLAIVEEAVLAIVSDEFALGPGGRRWLDEDEYLVRRRIHRDMQAMLAHSRL